MRERNIYKIDDYLIYIGYSALLFSLYGVTNLLEAMLTGTITFYTILLSVFIFSPIAMIIIGYSLRREEKKVNLLLNLLETVLDVGIKELCLKTGLPPQKIKKVIHKIESMGIGFYVWDEKLLRVYDRRLKDQFIFVETCPHCGAKLGKNYSLILNSIPVCEYCSNPFSMNYWNNLKLKAIANINKINLELYKLELDQKEKDTLNLPLLIFLFMFFWPLGVFYVLKHKQK